MPIVPRIPAHPRHRFGPQGTAAEKTRASKRGTASCRTVTVWARCTTEATPAWPRQGRLAYPASWNISTANAMGRVPHRWLHGRCFACWLGTRRREPRSKGDVLVTGAAGGVGSVAIALLDKLGYRVVASSRRAEQEARYCKDWAQMNYRRLPSFPGLGGALRQKRWAGAVDSLGSRTLPTYSQIKHDAQLRRAAWRRGETCPRPSCRLHPTRRGILAGVNSVLTPARSAKRRGAVSPKTSTSRSSTA